MSLTKLALPALFVVCNTFSVAEAREYYTATVKLEVYYSSPEETPKKLGGYTGKIRSSSDGEFKSVTMDGEEVPFDALKLESGYAPWHFCKLGFKHCVNVPDLDLTLSKNATMQLLRGANHSIWRSKSLKRKADALIERYAADPQVGGAIRIFFAAREVWYDQDYSFQSLELSDNKSADTLTIKIRTDLDLEVH